ncbi:ATP-grasp domain-containing protein [Micromonospora sp. WMMD1082]|uniref:ATP-grasp domain-containing protein n=1 Tax=Micromonospora sp. WMMD1082 TaxID=3016104 RepID=UPI0024161505|nr:ATP-grasp domain-containing protein [Micromonospora sp. WMMD1082]MDG4792751.1 ATP-grasp domain-containing protein [Micromonospora sp. WMMD1082]
MAKSLLLVYCRGGAPLEFAIPRLAQRAQVHVLALQQMPQRTAPLWQGHCAQIIPAWDERRSGRELVTLIVEAARTVGADAVFTLSEFAVMAVAEAAEELGLRGVGPNAANSRDKRLMRAVWEKAGVPSPRFRRVSSEADLRTAFEELNPPLLLKSAWGAGSVGQQVVSTPDDLAPAWAETSAAVAHALSTGFMELQQVGAERDFLAEEIIPGSTRTWWPEGSGYGDYLSVEGIVADGVYHPLCITSRIPTIPPFTELSNLAPCELPERLQRRIEEVSRAAVDALELGTCGTHTELKLMDDGEVSVIESAARLGGVMVAAELEHVFGYEPIGMLVDALLGHDVTFPPRMLTDRDARAAAGSLSLIATDAAGRPWSRDLAWDESKVDWSTILSPGSRIEAVPGLSIPPGTPLPRYDVTSGALGYGGIFFLRTRDAQTLVRDSYAVLDNLEAALAKGWENDRHQGAS